MYSVVCITLKAELPGGYSPLMYGSSQIFGSGNPSNAVHMDQISSTTWELGCVLPSIQDSSDIMFLIQNKATIIYGKPQHILGESTTFPISFPMIPENPVLSEVSVKITEISPFVLARCWRNANRNQEMEFDGYEVSPPASETQNETQYAADAAETPRQLQRCNVPSKSPNEMDRCMSIKDLVVMGEVVQDCRLIGTNTFSLKHEGPNYVDRSLCNSPGLVRLGSDVSVLNSSIDDLESKVKVMPAAAGAVAAGAVADRLLGPKERRGLAIVLVGLPARGKTFSAAKLTRYLRWLGHDTKHFNVGKYRRLKHGCTQNADFFRSDNQEGIDARNEVAALAMEDMLSWMDEGGQVGVFDATNSTKLPRKMLLKMAEGRCQVIFLETICRDQAVIDQNVRLKIRKSPDYADQPDYEAALADFKARLVNYSEAYEPVDEGSYIKMIDMVSEQDGQMQVNNISGYLPGRIVLFLVNTHLTPRPILLTRHGESIFNLTGRIGGDPTLTAAGEEYALKLAKFVNKLLDSQQTASIWTSTLQRTVLTARHITGFPKVQWRALDEINAGVCDGMTYEEIKQTMPEEYQSRKLDKLRYRYPRGESYLDVIQRLEPVIVELERQRCPVVVVAHQAILRSLYAYFTDKPLDEIPHIEDEIPHIEMPLHTVIEIQMGVAGVQEKRYKLIEN